MSSGARRRSLLLALGLPALLAVLQQQLLLRQPPRLETLRPVELAHLWQDCRFSDPPSAQLVEAYLDPTQNASHTEEYPYYPRQWVSPYIERRRKVGWDLYALLGLTRDNKSGMQAQHARNFAFFDAPVGLIFTIDRVMDQGSWLDYGMFLQTLMIAARARGLDTCPQAAFTQFHRLISETLAIPAEQQVVCGMALGYADPAKAENGLLTERAALSEFVTFMG